MTSVLYCRFIFLEQVTGERKISSTLVGVLSKFFSRNNTVSGDKGFRDYIISFVDLQTLGHLSIDRGDLYPTVSDSLPMANTKQPDMKKSGSSDNQLQEFKDSHVRHASFDVSYALPFLLFTDDGATDDGLWPSSG